MEKNYESLLFKFNEWVKESATLKLIAIGFLILVLLIPASMITDLILERQKTSESVIDEVSFDWSLEQTIAGPILIIPYQTYSIRNNERQEEIKHAVFLPEELTINGKIEPHTRKRGIYKVAVYSSDLEISGKFGEPDFEKWNIPERDILYQDAFVLSGITDLRGIKENIALNWNGIQRPFETGFDQIVSTKSGIKAKVAIDGKENAYAFRYNLKLNGSKAMNFIPVGKQTLINLQSPWKNPAFVGAFLPENYEIGSDGFVANWKTLHFNRNYPQQWLSDEKYDLQESSEFGVSLLLPVDHYQKTYRSAKYAVLIIALSFLTFFFIEYLYKRRIHPFQYILVGIALCIFYTLLLSLSEHLGFGLSYWISALSIVLLITYYLSAAIKNRKAIFAVCGIQLLLYLYIFVILQLQDYALLAGSIGLFVALAAVMMLSRKINWYKTSEQLM